MRNMNNDILVKTAIGGTILSGCIYLGSKIYDKLKKSLEESREREHAKQVKLEQDTYAFYNTTSDFKSRFDESAVCLATLSNAHIKDKNNKSYLYDKLKKSRDKAANCKFDNADKFDTYRSEFLDLFHILTDMDEDTIDAKIISMQNEDKVQAKLSEQAQKEYEAEQKHRREVELIEENRKKDVEVYKAKLSAEQAKLKTICKAMEKADKSINSTLNIKTQIED